MQSATTGERQSTLAPRYSRLSGIGFGVLVVLTHFFALAPLILYGLLFVASWRAETLIGHWPVAWVDDPWYSIPGDGLYAFLLWTINLFFGSALLGLCVVPVLAIVVVGLRSKHLGVWVWVAFLVLAFVGGLLLMNGDPADRMLWIAD